MGDLWLEIAQVLACLARPFDPGWHFTRFVARSLSLNQPVRYSGWRISRSIST